LPCSTRAIPLTRVNPRIRLLITWRTGVRNGNERRLIEKHKTLVQDDLYRSSRAGRAKQPVPEAALANRGKDEARVSFGPSCRRISFPGRRRFRLLPALLQQRCHVWDARRASPAPELTSLPARSPLRCGRGVGRRPWARACPSRRCPCHTISGPGPCGRRGDGPSPGRRSPPWCRPG
jgi:hypothetical protein